jgi:hypothetical protein
LNSDDVPSTWYDVDPSDFPLLDPNNEEKWLMTFSGVLEKAKAAPGALMKDMKFLITPSTKPEYEDLKEMIEASGGAVISDLPFKHADDVWIIGCQEDRPLIKAYTGWEDKVLTPEFIVSGTLKQELDFESYKLTKHRHATPKK